VKLTTRLRLQPRLRIRGAIPLLLHTFSDRLIWLITGTTLPLPLQLYNVIYNASVTQLGESTFCSIYVSPGLSLSCWKPTGDARFFLV